MIQLPVFDGNAACAEIGGDIWFPEPGGEGKVASQQARALCNDCEIRLPCLRWAIDNDEWGIWAGTTWKQRQKMRTA